MRNLIPLVAILGLLAPSIAQVDPNSGEAIRTEACIRVVLLFSQSDSLSTFPSPCINAARRDLPVR